MITALVIDDIGSQAAVLQKVALLKNQSSVGQTIVVSTDPQPATLSGAEWISSESLVAGLRRANSEATSKRVLIISSSLTLDEAAFTQLLTELVGRPTMEQTLISISSEQGLLELPEFAPESIVSALAKQELWPLLLVATNRSALQLVANSNAESITELLAQSLIQAMSDGDAIRVSSITPASVEIAIAKNLSSLSPEARARSLSAAIDAFNIEELFARHNWETFSQESAAAAYHSLAALFLKFGDTSSAIQCLSCSERLEESPRYFALKGLIQQSKGETLGAVANLVSSLQCYESRKVNDGKHYLTFKPQNLEVINSRLVDGLEALNKRENDRALTHFSEAVFNFDPFYAEYGVQSLTKIRA